MRTWHVKKRNFEVIIGKSVVAFQREDEEATPSRQRFGWGQTVTTRLAP